MYKKVNNINSFNLKNLIIPFLLSIFLYLGSLFFLLSYDLYVDINYLNLFLSILNFVINLTVIYLIYFFNKEQISLLIYNFEVIYKKIQTELFILLSLLSIVIVFNAIGPLNAIIYEGLSREELYKIYGTGRLMMLIPYVFYFLLPLSIVFNYSKKVKII